MDMLDAYGKKLKFDLDLEMKKYAQLASWISIPHMKKPLDPKKLYPDTQKQQKQEHSKEELQNIKESLLTRFGMKEG